MISSREAALSLYGAYRLARFDPNGLQFFEHSIGAFWRSFFAAVIVAPIFAIFLSIRYSTGEISASLPAFITYEAAGYIIAWLAFPVVMEGLSRTLDCRQHYVKFIIAYNWIMVIQNAVYLPIVIFGVGGMVSQGTANGLALIALMWTFIYTGYVATKALEIPPMSAAGIVFIDLLLALLIDVTVSSRM